jgi:hypothetical protein
MDALMAKLDRPVESARIKPARRLKELQHDEKMVAVNDRIEEATNYRNELTKLEETEMTRIDEAKTKNMDRQRDRLAS